ncbi:MAG: prepilin-type N-terminal cleavage/methylation domain-containing protein [Candidatus Omnitrophica bacterium]|nr:prepilin-type N-terminal cleavage/methylation domain-containing protein [Candidatus Omnitrophota bacterium]
MNDISKKEWRGKRKFISARLSALTLVELMVVVAIVGIISTASLLSISYTDSRRLETETRRIIGDLCWARKMAVARHINYIVDFDIVNEQYTVYEGSVSPANMCKQQRLVSDISLLAPLPNQVVFNFPSGDSLAKQIDLSYRGQTRQIIIFSGSGYVRMQ